MRMFRLILWLGLAVATVSRSTNSVCGDEPVRDPPKPSAQVLKTPGGVAFALLGEKPGAPAPTLFVFAQEMQATLEDGYFNKIGRLLAPRGFLCVSLDIPCHGADARPGEMPDQLTGWATRVRQDGNFVAPFTRRASQVLDYLIAEKYTDPTRVAVVGSSRGGFIALHTAAADERIRAVVAFAPVTHLPVLTEFAGLDQHEATLALSAIHLADKLAGKSVWTAIGNLDKRVGTDDCIALTRAIVLASATKQTDENSAVPVELRVVPTARHSIHPTAHDEAAAWLLQQFSFKP